MDVEHIRLTLHACALAGLAMVTAAYLWPTAGSSGRTTRRTCPHPSPAAHRDPREGS
ncbi:hypothetical protein [Streptomyces albogriseolus]|uniref:hypothetical protein n=1 Tax=Streptomyces albogriseolus TaxID=1887 RepID=UPI0034613FE2